jgi:DNA-binding transcriptional regulator YiaG
MSAIEHLTDAAIDEMDQFARDIAAGIIGGRNDYWIALEAILKANEDTSPKKPTPSGVARTIGLAIREVRRAAAMEQSELGEALGMSQSAVSRWESAETEISVYMLFMIARVTGAAPQIFMTALEEAYAEGESK